VPTKYVNRRFRPIGLDDMRAALPGYVHARGLRLERFAPIVPDATLRFYFEKHEGEFDVLVELDRTRRPVKNLDKLRRYDALITGWWRLHERFEGLTEPPAVVFVCTDEKQARSLMAVADRERAGCLVNPGVDSSSWLYPARDRALRGATWGSERRICLAARLRSDSAAGRRLRYPNAPVAIAQTHAESDCPNRVCARKLRV
jgi:hypothetical protein